MKYTITKRITIFINKIIVHSIYHVYQVPKLNIIMKFIII